MKRSFVFVALMFLAVPTFSGHVCLGQIPQTISYQGVLTDASGSAVSDGSYSIGFTLYDAATEGTILWLETQDVSINHDIFNAILGSVNLLDVPFDNTYWLGITVGEGSELVPRIELTSSAYSLN